MRKIIDVEEIVRRGRPGFLGHTEYTLLMTVGNEVLKIVGENGWSGITVNPRLVSRLFVDLPNFQVLGSQYQITVSDGTGMYRGIPVWVDAARVNDVVQCSHVERRARKVRNLLGLGRDDDFVDEIVVDDRKGLLL